MKIVQYYKWVNKVGYYVTSEVNNPFAEVELGLFNPLFLYMT